MTSLYLCFNYLGDDFIDLSGRLISHIPTFHYLQIKVFDFFTFAIDNSIHFLNLYLQTNHNRILVCLISYLYYKKIIMGFVRPTSFYKGLLLL